MFLHILIFHHSVLLLVLFVEELHCSSSQPVEDDWELWIFYASGGLSERWPLVETLRIGCYRLQAELWAPDSFRFVFMYVDVFLVDTLKNAHCIYMIIFLFLNLYMQIIIISVTEPFHWWMKELIHLKMIGLINIYTNIIYRNYYMLNICTLNFHPVFYSKAVHVFNHS